MPARRLPTPRVRRLDINWAVVEQRRIAAGMTHTQLAERVGMPAVTGPVRLWQDRDHDDARLGLLERLCQVLDLHPVELFAPSTRVAQRRALPRPEVVADDQVLEAALAPSARRRWPVSGLGRSAAAGWPTRSDGRWPGSIWPWPRSLTGWPTAVSGWTATAAGGARATGP